MATSYQPDKIEAHWRQHWENNQLGTPSGQGPAYTIMCPPPNVTGHLHMGHGFQLTLMDILIRYRRMCGDYTLWQVGTDHAGIATQMVVERQLLPQTRHDLGREAFVDKIWAWKDQAHQRITKQIKRLGASVDWENECFTLDPTLSKAVQHAFITLHKKGLIYRGKKLVNWDPVLQTAVSDLEVSEQTKQGTLWHILYPLSDGSGHVEVATTRPETLFGDQAVAVHPDDERYQHLIGKTVALPLTTRHIPIIADTYVDREFGTGCVKITPAHDFNDYDVGLRHDLDLLCVMHPDGRLNNKVPEDYQNQPIDVARKQVVTALRAQKLLHDETPHTHVVPMGDRSGAVLEPRLTEQWFVAMETLAAKGLDALDKEAIAFVPANWSNTYRHWLENIQDWCISRQLWWGHRIPAWYDDKGQCYVGEDEKNVRQTYQLDESIALTQDPDVLDTWFSSALWPFATLGWPENTQRLQKHYPTNVLVTGFDIIFFWVARMVMFGLEFTEQAPFQQIITTGLIRDNKGQKMSKSKGNVLDPLDLIDGISLDDLIEKRTKGLMQPQHAERIAAQTKQQFPDGLSAHGTDALRMTFCALANTGRDIRFDLSRLSGYRNFCNKLFNATRYVMMNTEGFASIWQDDYITQHTIHQWMFHRLAHHTQTIHQHLQSHRFDLLAHSLYDLIWHEYCDWYVELCKPLLKDAQHATATQACLIQALQHILQLAHPVIPFLTAHLWETLAQRSHVMHQDIARTAYPSVCTAHLVDSTPIARLQTIMIGLRTLRAELQISPKEKLTLYVIDDDPIWQSFHPWFDAMCQITAIEKVTTQPKQCIRWIGANTTAYLDVHGKIDLPQVMANMKKNIAKLEKTVQSAEKRLANPNYLAKAPQDVIDQLTQDHQRDQKTLHAYQQHCQELEHLHVST